MIFEQCKVGRFFAWAGRDPGIKSPVMTRGYSTGLQEWQSSRTTRPFTRGKHCTWYCIGERELHVEHKRISIRDVTNCLKFYFMYI